MECPNCEGNNPPTRRRCQWCGHGLPDPVLPDDTAPEVPIGGLPGPGPGDSPGVRLDAPAPAPAPGARRPQPAAASASASASASDSAPRPSSSPPRDPAGAFMPVSTEETELAAAKRKPHTDAARPCHFCSVMMEPDEWILVAGPKLVCRVCYHEEIRSKDKNAQGEGGDAHQGAGEGAGGEQGAPGATGKKDARTSSASGGGQGSGPSMNWKAGAGYLVPGVLCLAGGAAVTVV